jgi:monothiol glutaredoxin
MPGYSRVPWGTSEYRVHRLVRSVGAAYNGLVVTEQTLTDQIRNLIDEHPVLLFMKGTPDQPRCGFSARVVQALNSLDVEYGALDVLPALEPLREATGEISDWRTFPQLYVNGELVGGADIVEEMLQSGELARLLEVEQPESVPPPAPPQGQTPPLQIED